jgi:NADH-quinone oxidoreductase subunit L
MLGQFFWEKGDVKTIDGLIVNGSARTVGKLAGALRYLQTGLLNQYAFIMILGLLGLVSWWFWVLV